MKNILQNRLYYISHRFPVQINAIAAYGPTCGVKGGLRFMKCSKTADGNYRIQMKNIWRIKSNISDLTDGDFTFDTDRVTFYQYGITYLGTAASGALTNFSCAYMSSDKTTTSLLTFDNTGALQEPISTIKVESSVTFSKYAKRVS